MGEAAKAPLGRQRPGQAAAVGQVLGDVAGARPRHPSETGVWGTTEPYTELGITLH
jgi:hypothetical protein